MCDDTDVFMYGIGNMACKKFGTYFTLPLLVVGIAAGARNAYVLVMNVVKSEENRRKKRQEDEIKRKIERANQEKENDKQT